MLLLDSDRKGSRWSARNRCPYLQNRIRKQVNDSAIRGCSSGHRQIRIRGGLGASRELRVGKPTHPIKSTATIATAKTQ